MSKALIQKERISYAIDQLGDAGIDVHFESKAEIRFMYNGDEVKFFPYTGWFTGKSVKDGRGITNLLKQLKK